MCPALISTACYVVVVVAAVHVLRVPLSSMRPCRLPQLSAPVCASCRRHKAPGSKREDWPPLMLRF